MDLREQLQDEIIQEAGHLFDKIRTLATLNAAEEGMTHHQPDLDEMVEHIHAIQRTVMADHGRLCSDLIWFRPFGARGKQSIATKTL